MWDQEKPKRKNGELSLSRTIRSILIITAICFGIGLLLDIPLVLNSATVQTMQLLKDSGITTDAEIVEKTVSGTCGCKTYTLTLRYIVEQDIAQTEYTYQQKVSEAIYENVTLGNDISIMVNPNDYNLAELQAEVLNYQPPTIPPIAIFFSIIGLVGGSLYWRFRWRRQADLAFDW